MKLLLVASLVWLSSCTDTKPADSPSPPETLQAQEEKQCNERANDRCLEGGSHCLINTITDTCEKKLTLAGDCSNLSTSEFQCQQEASCNYDAAAKTCQAKKPVLDLAELLVVKNLSDFTKTASTLSGTGSGTKYIYEENTSGRKFLFKEGGPTAAEPAWLEAYAGVLYKYLLQEHAPMEYFVRHVDGAVNKLYAAIELAPTFNDAFDFHVLQSKPLLDDKDGLARIIVASMLLGEIDLKGVGSNDSNLGIVEENGQQIYFKIDHGQSFVFGDWAWVPKKFSFKLPPDRMTAPSMDDDFLANIGFATMGAKPLPADYLPAIKEAAKDIASIDRSELEKILDFCEQQLAWAGIDPVALIPEHYGKDDPLGTRSLFDSPQSSLKMAIITRFDQLKAAVLP